MPAHLYPLGTDFAIIRTIAGASFAIAKFLAGLFLILFRVFLIIGLSAARRIID